MSVQQFGVVARRALGPCEQKRQAAIGWLERGSNSKNVMPARRKPVN